MQLEMLATEKPKDNSEGERRLIVSDNVDGEDKDKDRDKNRDEIKVAPPLDWKRIQFAVRIEHGKNCRCTSS